MNPNKRFENKVVLITGTGGGQGRAAALKFAREGATVIGCDINPDAHAETCELLKSEGFTLGGSAPVDLGDVVQAKTWVETAGKAHGRIDVLYNNASAAKFGLIGELSIDDWHYTIRNELDLVFYTTRYAWQYLKVDGGVVINIASTAGWGGNKSTGLSAHCATKGAIISFTRQLAVEGAPVGIRAVSISPGLVRTPGTAPFLDNPAIRESLLEEVLLNRPGEPEEIVALAAFVASDEGAFMTGCDLVSDGGRLAT